jgi:hypothetical protein
MAIGSQQEFVSTKATLTGILHEIYAGEVKPAVRAFSPVSQLFTDATPGQYRIDGEKLVGSTDLTYAGGAMHTAGYLPDHTEIDAVEWNTTATRAYRRGAIDNFIQRSAVKGPGSFANLLERLYDQMWDSFKRLEVRSAIGGSSGIICLVSAKTTSAIIVVKDGYNHTGTDPLMHLEVGMWLAWLDSGSAYAVGGTGQIHSINYSTNTITFEASIENGSGTPTIAAGDVFVFCTTNLYSHDYFSTEYNVARQGLMDIVDPDAASVTVQGISGTTYPRWKPMRAASATFDHIELTEHWAKLAAKSTEPVTPQSHTAFCSPAVYAELARTLEAYQQQQQLGKTFEGGYQAVRVAGMDLMADPWMLHNVLITLCGENLYNADLGEPDYFDEDGSMFSRIEDFDGKSWFIADYRQWFTDRRNRHGALTAIALPNVTASDFSPSPNL